MRIALTVCIISSILYTHNYGDARLREMGRAAAVGIATLAATEQVVPLIVGTVYSACTGTDPLAHSDEIVPVSCGVSARLLGVFLRLCSIGAAAAGIGCAKRGCCGLFKRR